MNQFIEPVLHDTFIQHEAHGQYVANFLVDVWNQQIERDKAAAGAVDAGGRPGASIRPDSTRELNNERRNPTPISIFLEILQVGVPSGLRLLMLRVLSEFGLKCREVCRQGAATPTSEQTSWVCSSIPNESPPREFEGASASAGVGRKIGVRFYFRGSATRLGRPPTRPANLIGLFAAHGNPIPVTRAGRCDKLSRLSICSQRTIS